jgi:hypothetical protein
MTLTSWLFRTEVTMRRFLRELAMSLAALGLFNAAGLTLV